MCWLPNTTKCCLSYLLNISQIYPGLSVFCLHCFNNVLSSNGLQFVPSIHSAICNDSQIQICPHCSEHKECIRGNSPAVQWLALCAFTAEGPGSIPGRGTKILQAERCGQKRKKECIPYLGLQGSSPCSFIPHHPLHPLWHYFQCPQETHALLWASAHALFLVGLYSHPALSPN